MAQPDQSNFQNAVPEIGVDDPRLDNMLRRHLDSAPEQFFQALLRTALEVTGVLAGQIWGLDRSGRLSNICTTDPERFLQFEQPEMVDHHRDLISEALFGGKIITSPLPGSRGQELAGRVLWLAPISGGVEPIGVLEFILPSKFPPPHLEKLKQLPVIASAYLSERVASRSVENNRIQPALDKRQPAPDRNSKSAADAAIEHHVSAAGEINSGIETLDIESLVYLLHNQIDLEYVTSTAVNEVRRMLRLDRVSLAIVRSGKIEVIAISGQDRVQVRSNAVRALQKIGVQVIRSGKEVSFGIRDESQPLETSRLKTGSAVECLNETGASVLVGIPLYEPEKIDFDSEVHVSDQTVFAALLVEQFSGKRPIDQADLQRVAAHISQATFHSLNQDQIFLLPMRRRLGKWAVRLKFTRSRARLALGLLVGAVLILTFLPVPYRVQATGRLMPVQQFRAFAPFSGEVQEVLIGSGQQVEPAQPLLRLHDEELETRRLILTNNLAERKKLLEAYKAQLDDRSNSITQPDRIGLSAKIAQYQLEVSGLQQQIESADILYQRSIVRSNIAGTIATFRPEDLLAGRPVSRGELLVEVMNEQGPWQLELRLPEKRLGHLLQSIEGSTSRPSLTFVQATSPADTFHGTVGQVATRSIVDGDGSSTILLNAEIDETPGLRRTIGAEVSARIDCGTRSLGYVCFGDAIEWLQRRLW